MGWRDLLFLFFLNYAVSSHYVKTSLRLSNNFSILMLLKAYIFFF